MSIEAKLLPPEDGHFRLALPPELLDALVERVAEKVLDHLDAASLTMSPYLTVLEAAEYLRCSRQRVYDLLSSGRLTRLKDGSRVLLSRRELDEYLAG